MNQNTNFLACIFAALLVTALMAGALAAKPKRAKVRGSKNSNDATVMGAGRHKYEWVSDWAKLPEGMQTGNMHGAVQVDSKGLIYFSAESEHAVMVFDQNGKFIRSFGKEWKTDKPGEGIHGMQLVKEGGKEFLYLTHLDRHEFAKITLEGETVWVKGWPEQTGIYTKKEEFKPTGIAVAPNGDVYVTDGYGKNFIHHYKAKGEYVRSWGGKGTEDGKFNTPHAIIIDTRGKEPTVLLTDRAQHRLQWFSLDGKHLRTLPGDNDLLRLPATLHIRGNDLVVGDLSGRVTIFDKDNKLITHLGDNIDPKKRATNRVTPDQWLAGQFISPHGICWDQKGNLYVEEWLQTGRIVKLKRLK
jgi:hypothetical protein